MFPRIDLIAEVLGDQGFQLGDWKTGERNGNRMVWVLRYAGEASWERVVLLSFPPAMSETDAEKAAHEMLLGLRAARLGEKMLLASEDVVKENEDADS